MKIGIFGGCFNPPHKMHQDIAVKLIEKKYLEQVIYVPTSNYYQKKELIHDKKRLEMLELMCKDNKKLKISDYEFKKLTYTYQTLKYFKEQYPDDELYFICGSDNLNQFDTWKEYKWILTNFKLLVIKRNHDDIEKIMKKYNKYKKNIITTNINENYLSSTIIREKIKVGKLEEVKDYLSDQVYLYIKKEKLYQNNE